VLNRRDFCMSILAVPALTSNLSLAFPAGAEAPKVGADTFPLSDYTPYGYLDNPFHCWNLHRSGILRSSPGIGFGFYFPAGPGGYFDFAKNGVYEAHLRVGFLIDGRPFWTPDNFRPDQLVSSYHSKNLFTFAFTEGSTQVECTFLQIDEDALAARIVVQGQGAKAQSVQLITVVDCRLGGSAWWGRDGLSGSYAPVNDSLWIRSFAAGPVFTLLSDASSEAHFLGENDTDLEAWMASPSNRENGLSYHPHPLRGALSYKLDTVAGAKVEHTIVMARGENRALSYQQARRSLEKVREQFSIKYGEDAEFWRTAPRLEGDWPKHWKHGWVYDLETLRMMVRRPIGLYKNPWDAMQIQAPRNVLAETSIDVWALSYADAEDAKAVFLGQFLDAPSDNVPCMREDGEMNMVAADGSECGTSISWCYPFFCAESIWSRTRDKRWLSEVYPRLGRLLRWTLKERVDAGGFVIGKCSWETGMDTSSRFLIQQPTGGELIEFLRVVELQAAASQAAEILARFSGILGDAASMEGWKKLQQVYAAKTQELWKDDWFYDFDTRNGQLVTSVGKDLGQVAPVFCGVASDDQKSRMRPALRKMYADSMSRHLAPAVDWQDGLHWSSLVLPYLESLRTAGEMELLSQVVQTIAERIYTSMDRHSVHPGTDKGGDAKPATTQKLGWPGVSCEVWGSDGAYGGEGYGWGAVLPAHIIRNLVGFHDPLEAGQLWLSPNLPESFVVAGKVYRVRNLQYAEETLDLAIRVVDSRRVRVEGLWSGSIRTVAVKDAAGTSVALERTDSGWQFEGSNRQPYLVLLSGVATAAGE
jgi:hypothetical protein